MMVLEIRVTGRQSEETYEYLTYEVVTDGTVVGAASVMVDASYAYLERIDIDAAHQGKGCGTAAILALAKEHGGIVAAPDNEDSQRLFDRLGYDVSEKYWMVDQGFGVFEI